MAYRVVLADSAKADANAIYERVIAEAPIRGPEWFLQLMECLHSLDHLPDRCPRAREAEQAKREIRCLLFGRRRNKYRILYEVDERRKTVWILHIRHGSRQDLAPEDFGDPFED
jgi:plasmid stabilization system protein ParE